MKNLWPFIFNSKYVYYKYYYNDKALPLYMVGTSTTFLHCKVYGIPKEWNYLLFII